MSDKMHISFDDIVHYTSLLRHAIAPVNRPGCPPIRAIVGVARGGLPIMTILSNALDIRQPNLGVVYGASYNHREEQHAVKIHLDQATADLLRCNDTLIIDEIYDSGTTYSSLRKLFPNPVYAALFKRNPSPDLPGLLWQRDVPEGKWLVFPWE